MTQSLDSTMDARSTASQLLPTNLWKLPLTQLPMPDTLADALAAHSILTVGDLLDLPPEALGVDGVISPAEQEQVHTALSRALDDGLRQFDSAAANDWPTLRAHRQRHFQRLVCA